MSYEPGKVEEIRSFYTDLFGWDIIETEHSDPENPVLFCATGPGTPDWEPRVCSFEYVFLKPKTDDAPDTSIIIEVKDIDETLQKAVEFGGKVLKERFTFEGEQYALIEDSEGNPYYIWEIKDKLPDYVTNPVTRTGAQ